MSKEDKQFFTGLISSLEASFRHEIVDLRTDLGSQIRHNGVLIEKMQDDIELLCEGHETMHGQLKKVAEDVEEIKENTHDLPIIRQTVTNHSVALLELRK